MVIRLGLLEKEIDFMLVDFFDRLYSSIIGRNVFLNKIRFYSVLRFSVRQMANVILPVYLKMTRNNPAYQLEKLSQKKKGRIIVSITSFPVRIDKVWLTIETILRQTKKPDMIILWLSKEQFPTKEILPRTLLAQEQRGLRIELRDGDLRSHKKYYYTLTEYPDDCLLTMDDDIFYPTYAIEKLYSYHEKYPEYIISNYSFRIKYAGKDPMLYSEWENNVKESAVGYDLFFGTGGGTLFPIGSLADEALNESVALKICRTADDVWLNGMCRLKKKKIVKTDYFSMILPVLIKNDLRLARENVDRTGNDCQIKELRRYCVEMYGIDPFLKDI